MGAALTYHFFKYKGNEFVQENNLQIVCSNMLKQQNRLQTCRAVADRPAFKKLRRQRPQIAFPGNKLGDKAAAPSKSSPEGKSWRETSLGDKAAAAAKSSPERKSWRKTILGDKAAARQPRSAQKGNHEGRQAWETRRQRQPRAAQKGNHEGRQAYQEQPRKEIMKGDKLGRQGGSGSQEQLMKGSSREGKSWRETSLRDKAAAAAKGNHEGREKLGRQGGSGITTIRRFRKSATQSLRSKNAYSFQLSGDEENSVSRVGLIVHTPLQWCSGAHS